LSTSLFSRFIFFSLKNFYNCEEPFSHY
jgi:hypothetical protein